ncbi:type II toxin-antitoxin system HicA family toxin [Streptomyces sp. NPDC058745]|uniref:type II toxin-antitoxin system HicA family toxin n=1 Tax=Streptomyces sp. NPDC058745 TaxID=3346621 RepID=UPI003681A6F0
MWARAAVRLGPTRVLVKKISDAAKANSKPLDLLRQSGSHQFWRCGTTRVVIPKHSEINEITAESICKTLEAELGEGWWR